MCYTTAVQTSFYVSGFLYSSKTNQILLLKSQNKESSDFIWSTIGGESREEASKAFQRIINELLDLNLKAKNIYPIYNYFHEARNKDNYVFYAEVKSPKKFKNLKEDSFSWVSFNEISKFSFASNSKQDVIVGQRVINTKCRNDEALVLQNSLPS